MKPWRELFFEEVEPPHHFHIGMRIIKTVIAVFICGLLGWLRDETSFFSMIAAVLCMQKSAEKTFTTSFNRIMGTAVGGVFGVVVLFLETELHVQRVMPVYYLIVSLMLIPVIMSTIAIKKPSVAGFACVVFLSTTIYHVGDASPYTYALNGAGHSRGADREPRHAGAEEASAGLGAGGHGRSRPCRARAQGVKAFCPAFKSRRAPGAAPPRPRAAAVCAAQYARRRCHAI